MDPDLVVRLFEPDDAAALTSLLHTAYAELGDLGLNFTAVDQDVETTLHRATAAPATHLVNLYEGWGFTTSGSIHWDGKTYDSIVMTRPLEG